MRDPNNPCLFCNSKTSGVAHENDLAYASYDTYPVSDHHCLIIPKRHVDRLFRIIK
jgi:diadenosine tetraphosphate (Ap4A) HIT family hydrolase